MSRFINLEFNSDSEDHSERVERPLLKDEAHYSTEARLAFESGNFEAALRLYSKVLEFNPQNVSAWTGQVRMLIELNEFKEAKLWADKAVERFPHEPELLAAKAVTLARAGDLDGAISFSDAAIEERGDTPYVWLARGDVLLACNERRAEYCFEKALLLAPRDWFIAWLVARIRFYYEQFALALKLLQQAVSWKADHFVLWLELGLCQKSLGLVGPARDSFGLARQLNPQCSEITLHLARLSQVGLWTRLCGFARGLFSR